MPPTLIQRKNKMNIKFPDYEKNILSVSSSILKYFGVTDCPYTSLPEINKALENKPDKVILLLFDGLGTVSVNSHLNENSFLRSHLACSVSSVFPPTTVAATTSILSGKSPLEHSRLGWDLYFKEIDENVAVFPNTLQRDGTLAADYNLADRYVPFETVFERIKKASPEVSTSSLAPFLPPYPETAQALLEAVTVEAHKPGKGFIYAYCTDPDHTMHERGVNDSRVHDFINEIDGAVESLSKRLEKSLIIVIADHGLLDAKNVCIEDCPEINELLVRPGSMEPRALSLWVKPGKESEFRDKFEQKFGDKFLLFSKEEVYAKHLLGFGTPGERTDGFLGDFLAVAISDLCLTPIKSEFKPIGNHAGLTCDEMTVPVIIINS